MLRSMMLLAALGSCAPETWFHVIGGNASEEGMKADIAAIAEAGISGIQFFHGAGDGTWPGVTNPIPCLSERWVDLVKCAETECHRRGLTFKMQNCPGWSMSGGPWITSDRAMRRIVAFESWKRPNFSKDDDFREIASVTFPLEDSDDLSVTFPNPGKLSHSWAYEPAATIFAERDGRRVWSRAVRQGTWQDEDGMTWRLPHGRRYGTNLQFFVESTHYARRKIDAKVADSVLLDDWEAKGFRCLREFSMSTNAAPVRTKGTRTLVFGHINTQLKNHPAPPEATGWECDKMDARGFEANFAGYLGRLLEAGVKIDGTLVDSWECFVPNWTWKMEEEFKRRAGYELKPWLPAIFGYVLGSEAETEKFLLDWRRVCSGMIEDNYFGTIAKLGHEHGMHVQYETAFGDVVPGDLMRFWKFADEPMCEFWHPHDNNGYVGSHDFKPVLPCVSAAHLYGKRRVSAESLTSFHLTFGENFKEWKRTIDKHFCRGVTHIVFHTYTHNPIVGGKPPSTSFGTWIGSPFLRLQPWWPYMKEFTKYLETCGRELERGVPVVDILMYVGDALGHKPHENKLLFDNKYKYDYLNAEVLRETLTVKDGRLVVAKYPAHASQTEPMSYRVLWIPKETYVAPESAAKIAALGRSGARVIRGDFTPDWPSPLAAIGRAKSKGLEWYQRRDGDEDIFFLMEKNDATAFLRVKGEKVSLMNPVTGKTRSFDDLALKASPPGEREIALKPLNEYPYWATNRVYEAELPAVGGAATLDLGRVCDWATVEVDGKVAARLWCEPYAVDVSRYLSETRPVKLRVTVTSTIRNMLSHDAELPENARGTWTLCGPGKGVKDPSGLYGPALMTVTPIR